MITTPTEPTLYNGWTNFETWLTVLNLDNDPVLYAACRLYAEDQPDQAAQNIRETVEEHIDALELPNGLASDMLQAALAQVNWREIADHYIDQA